MAARRGEREKRKEDMHFEMEVYKQPHGGKDEGWGFRERVRQPEHQGKVPRLWAVSERKRKKKREKLAGSAVLPRGSSTSIYPE